MGKAAEQQDTDMTPAEVANRVRELMERIDCKAIATAGMLVAAIAGASPKFGDNAAVEL